MKGHNMDGTNGGWERDAHGMPRPGAAAGTPPGDWPAACERMAADANAAEAATAGAVVDAGTATDWDAAEKAAQAERDRTYTTVVRQVAGGREPFAALVALIHHAFEECGRECQGADYVACNPRKECTRAEHDANALAAYEHAAGAMFDQIQKLRDAAERMAAERRTTATDWDAAYQRMAAQARTAADANWRSLALELAAHAHATADAALAVVGRDESGYSRPRPPEVVAVATNMARNCARHTLAVVQRVLAADA